MAGNNYKVLITTSGLGQRLGELTKYTNKSLVRIGKKPTLSYVVESYPKDIPLVITIGYFGEQVKDFMRLAYPDRKVEFVKVDNYDGPGSSLGYSMLCARDHLQCPFIYHASDTIVKGKIPAPKHNWVGVCKGDDTSQYASWKVLNGKNIILNDKGAIDFDYLHIGLNGIKDYKIFWKILEDLYKKDPDNSSLGDCPVIIQMLKNGNSFKLTDFPTWFDIGNVAALDYARKNIGDAFDNLDKVDESLYIFKDFVIKFFYDEKTAKNRVKRAKILSGIVPEIEESAKNFYRYKYIDGDLYSRVVNPVSFNKFLKWSKNNLWKKTKEVSDEKFKKACYDFYFNKTTERIKKFLDNNSIKDAERIINGEKIPTMKDLLKMIDFDWLSSTNQRTFHGDFILDNILKTKDSYCLLDWRQDFGGLLESGDVYYDLAKLNHNLTVNHDIIHQNLFIINVNNNKVECDIMRKDNLVKCQDIFFNFLKKEKYDIKKVQLLTALIWLNMSPLHHHPFNLFLYYFGKLNLWRALKETKK